MESGAIERRSGMSWGQFLDEYVRLNKPVILTDASKQWEANKLFSPEFFQSVRGIGYRFVDVMN